ncbi:MAG: DUF2537 domain-containing protein [Pseudonocardiaceae bacterium]|nr:DUF2537 domain-containing protein [Pseudonocardiaceae bacterium]
MELHAHGDRAVVVGSGDAAADPERLALPEDLVTALHEWARVAQAVHDGGDREVRLLASSRGRQLAARVAGHAGVVVGYADPVEGGIELIRPSSATAEPTPWGTGLTISAVAATIAVVMLVALAEALSETSRWLSALAMVLVAAGLAPSIWLLRDVPVWRWVAYGVAAGIGCGWVVLLLSLLG